MTRTDINKIVENHIKTLDHTVFQDFCDKLLIKLYPDYTPVRAGGNKGDMKNDGYCYVNRKFFQAHASRNEAIAKIKTKIETDLKGCLQKQSDVQEFIYITNDTQVGEVEAFVDELRKSHSNITIATWGPLRICEEMKNMSDTEIEQVLGYNLSSTASVNNTLNQQNNFYSIALSEEEDLGIIEEIFNFISGMLEIKSLPDTTDDNGKKNQLKHLLDKIKINFHSDQQQSIREMYNNLWNRTQLVQRFIQDLLELPGGEDKLLALKDDVQSKFRSKLNKETTDVVINDVGLFDAIAIDFLPENKRKNPNYIGNAKAIVLYFFELCDIGKKTEQDNSKSVQSDLFSDF